VKTGMAVDYKNPREVGADRIANAVAAREQFGSPVIVMDCGTATTFDIVSPQGHYAGGLILPGVELALAALCRRAARLPEVSFGKMETLIGRDTVSSMQAGSYWGAVESLNGIIHKIHALAGYENAPVIATGGQIKLMLEDISGITEYRSRLTLEGLLLLAKRHFN
ncbi:MAG: type III pantothenate kinase, partial [Mariprofundaceae bacterium]|nr:type III pantothenate kinase [Mariprofundaceae bacterium]